MEKYMLSLNENNNVLNDIHIIKDGLIKMNDKANFYARIRHNRKANSNK